MTFSDDELKHFEDVGAELPSGGVSAYVENDGAQIWHASFGAGPAVILLHGGLGHAGNWQHQVQPLVDAGHQVVVVDSRGHGHSSRDGRPYSYELMATDVFAVMDALGLKRAAIVGWSDGAVIGLIMADKAPERVSGLFYFACNVDDSGTYPFEMTPVIGRCFNRHVKDYGRLSATPDAFQAFADAVGLMQRTQPNYSAAQLEGIRVPVTVAQSEKEEFIRPEHAAYLARTIPGAELVLLPVVSHFAPLQRPEVFNAQVLRFLGRVGA
ncbi:alpha/beta hydrolase [Devosia sp. Root105]|uniref:alpha/beta fold hydrolase n=1 Tax=Devosia sp. Root105 TaxID=1736423 RepID=UPI0006F3671F|nr:alpha/beta hydrolase [Devosia sp. Root105]KQU94253.1 alpha/beta hydrolase [Devosia sp. Root105]